MSSSSVPASEIHAVVATQFAAVNQSIYAHLNSDVPLVEKIGEYIIQSGGKRLRPLIALLGAHALGYQGEKHILLAALIEYMHTSTLLHDDVVDESTLRRGRPTANTQWGNQASVLVGDFLYSRSFEMMVKVGSMRVMEILSAATCVIAEGEVLQLLNIGNADLDEAAYMQVIHGKTAMLFEAAAQSAAVLAQATQEQEEALQLYGRKVGMAFQVIDDLLDYQGEAATMGKNVGDDLAEGKPTLPLIYALSVATEEEQALIRTALSEDGLQYLPQIMAIIERTGALAYTRQTAERLADEAIAVLKVLPASVYKTQLEAIAHLAVARKN